jgi:hypothetical protein
VTLTGAAGSNLGLAVAGGQDLTGDNIDDVAVGSPGTNSVQVHVGSRTGLSATALRLTGPAGATDFGSVLAAAGDVNGDGIGDLAVGSPGAARVDVYFGRIGATTASVALTGEAGSGFGAALALAGDLNHDGYSDLAVAQTTPREVRVYLGSPSGPVAATAVTLRGPSEAMDFGVALSGVADTDGDRLDDLAIGARGPTAVFLHRGTMTGPAPMASALALPAALGTLFSVLGAGR